MSTYSTKWWVLLQHKKELESLLSSTSDFSHLLQKLLNNEVISQDFSSKFSSLDQDPDHLEPEVKVRYLLRHVLERVKEDGKVFKRLVEVLSKLGGTVRDECKAMSKDVANMELIFRRKEENEIKLVTKDVPYLVQSLVFCSHLWEEIGFALGIPEYKRDDCKRCSKKNVFRLENLLKVYIQGDYEGARPATLNRLKEALAGDVVRQKVLAFKLEMPTHESENPISNISSLELDICQSYYNEVAVGKSTLLEVLVSGSECESYQWSKNGQPLVDGADYSGVYSNILYINNACNYTEGKYSCIIDRGDESECSENISLRVIYPPEREKLLKLYSNRERNLGIDSWPPTGTSEFINLALVRKQRKGMSTYNYYTVRGNMDDILESKEVVKYEEVFEDFKEGGLLLIEGRPGCGKTTLVKKLARDWAEGKKILQGAKMVFLVTLRCISESGKDKSLLDLLQIYYGNVLNKIIEHDLQKSGGKGACFILDGLDEYPIEKKKNLVIDDLLNTETLLPDSMVIVASRPVATNKLKQRCKTHIEVIGFYKDQVYTYVKSYPFHDSGMVVKMEHYLEQHPNILHMCYLPVHAAMICFLFSTKGNIPQTETEVYVEFTIATILRHEVNKSEGLSQIMSLIELSGKEKALFSSVCELAYNMIINSQQVIKKSDRQISFSNNFYFGLLTVERTYEYYGSEDLYTFHHLTFQEFLAAFYIHTAEVEHVKLIRHNSLRNVWKFYCGLTPLFKNIKFAIQICQIYCYPLNLQCAFESQCVELCDCVIEDENISVGGDIVSSIAQGYVLFKCTKPVTKITVEDCWWNNEGVKLFALIATSDKLQSIRCLAVSIGVELLVVIKSLLSHLQLLEELDLSSTKLTKSRIECLTSGIVLPQLKILRISLSLEPPYSYPETVLTKLTFCSINVKQVFYKLHRDLCPNINYGIWKKILSYAFGCQVIQESDRSWLYLYNSVIAFPCERVFCCIEVVLVNCSIDDEKVEILAKSLNPSVLEKLILDFNRISDVGTVKLAHCLARCEVVQEVSIQCNSIGDSGATALANELVHCSSLRKLDLQGNRLRDKGAVAIAVATESLPKLDLYLHNVDISAKGIEEVLQHRPSTSIRNIVFNLSWDSISEADIDTLRRALQCGNLPALKLSCANISNIDKLVAEQKHLKNITEIKCSFITDDAVPTLCNILKYLPNLHYIEGNLSYISSSSTQAISESLKTCKSLHTLSLRHSKHSSILLEAVKCFTKLHFLDLSCSLGSEGVSPLFRNTEFWVNLHTLNLCNNDFSSDGEQILSNILVHCKSLRCLNLSNNKIGIMAIAEGLKDHTSLLELNLGSNIACKGVAALSHVISCNHQLQHLNLAKCSLGPEGVATLIDVICGDFLLTLNLGGNGLGDDGIESLSGKLNKFTQLAELNISDNNISSHGMAFLCKGLKYTKLQKLSLKMNNITSDGIACLSEGLQHCTQLQRLNLSGNNITSEGVVSLSKGLQYCTELQELYLSGNKITSDGITCLSEGLECCAKLQKRNINVNSIRSGISAIHDIMKNCKYLWNIDLSDNNIGMDGVAVLIEEWQHKSLLTLDLYDWFDCNHESALKKGSKHCDSCGHLLQLYHNNDYVEIDIGQVLPKLLTR